MVTVTTPAGMSRTLKMRVVMIVWTSEGYQPSLEQCRRAFFLKAFNTACKSAQTRRSLQQQQLLACIPGAALLTCSGIFRVRQVHVRLAASCLVLSQKHKLQLPPQRAEQELDKLDTGGHPGQLSPRPAIESNNSSACWLAHCLHMDTNFKRTHLKELVAQCVTSIDRVGR